MQWSISGSVNWTAPRIIALGFTPALAIGVLIFFVVGSMTMQPRPGQEEAVTTLLGLGGCFIGAHVFHLWLIGRTLRRGSRRAPLRPISTPLLSRSEINGLGDVR